MPLVDLSHTIRSGMVTYPGLPAPEVGHHLTFDASHEVYAAGTEFAIGRIEMVGNTGTYLDTPAHRHRQGHDLSELPLSKCALLPAVVVDGPAEGPTTLAAFELVEAEEVEGAAVLVRTGWDQHFGFERYGDASHPYLATEAAQWLADHGAVLVGIDSVNIDATPPQGDRPVHTLLLDAEIPVVEHLTNLEHVPARGATFTAVPAKVAGMATFPVRAFVEY
jgi:arylformamidase